MIKILFVCHGNICRSPMAEFVMKDLVKRAGREQELYIASAATSCEEIGNPVHYGTKKKLGEYGISVAGKFAIQMTKQDYNEYDYIVMMDGNNVRNGMRILGSDPYGKVCKLLDFTEQTGDIADPWYTGNFDTTYDDVLRGCTAMLAKI